MNLIFLVFAIILVLSVICGRYIHTYRFKYATEGSASLLLGATSTGIFSVIYWLHTRQPLPQHSLELPDSVFFHILLPPIIFYAGFSIKKRMFFQNFCTIFTFGFLGTLSSAVLISLAAAAALQALGMAHGLLLQNSLALGAVCACSDTVAILQIMDKRAYPVLYSLVFGEGIVNDAVAVVLLGAVSNLTSHQKGGLSLGVLLELLLGFVSLFASSLALGVGMGLLSALMVRHIFSRHHDCDREVLLLALLGYMSYLLADALELSAILAVFFCGVTISHYTWHSLCPASQALALHTFRLGSGLMEMILYAYSGINIWTSGLWQQPAPDPRMHLKHALVLSGVLLVAIAAARVAFTYPVAAAASWLMSCGPERQQQRRISCLDATVIMWGGLARGAITLALAYHHFSPERKGVPTSDHQVMILAVVVVVLVSTVVLGTVTGPLMELIMMQHKRQQHKQHQHQLQQYLCSGHQQRDSLPATGLAGAGGNQFLEAGTQQLCTPLLLQQHQHEQLSSSKVAAPAAGAAWPQGKTDVSEGGIAVVLPSGAAAEADVGGAGGCLPEAASLTSSTRHGSSSGLGLVSAEQECETAMPPFQATANERASSGAAPAALPLHATPFGAATSAPPAPAWQSGAGAAAATVGGAPAPAQPSAAAMAAAAAAVAAGQRRWLLGSAASIGHLAARGRLPSMDELTEYAEGDTEQNTVSNGLRCGASPSSSTLSLSSIAEAEAAVADAGAAAAAGSTLGGDAAAAGFQQQQQQLLAAQQLLVRQQLQRLQLSRYGSSVPGAGELPFVATPSDSDAECTADLTSLGTYLALSRAPSGSSSSNGTRLRRQQQPLLLPSTAQQHHHQLLGAETPGQSVPVELTTAAAGDACTGWRAGGRQSEVGREQQWYLRQQLRLLRQLAQLQQEAVAQQQRQQQARSSSTGGDGHCVWDWSVHRAWRWLDVHYLQPLFGGREVAARTSVPMEFEHYGVSV